MRLNSREVDVITKSIRNRFGDSSRVLLFGSRVDDAKKGGDIDLLVITRQSMDEMVKNKLKAMTDIQLSLGERKIDIVTWNDLSREQSPTVVREALSTGIEL